MKNESKETVLNNLRTDLLSDFKLYVSFIFESFYGVRFSFNSHHYEMIDICEKIANKQLFNTVVNIAPRFSKTEIMVKMFISWSMAQNPKARFIHLSYSDSLALDNSNVIKDIILSAEYQRLFPWVKISKSEKAKDKWKTTAGGGVLARSSAGQVTGFGAGQVDFDKELIDFGGAIIIDDPIKPDDAKSTTKREAVNFKFESTIKNRRNSRDTPIIVIMQRLHNEDLSGYILSKYNDYTHISFPVAKIKPHKTLNFDLDVMTLRNLTNHQKKEFEGLIEPLWQDKMNAKEIVNEYITAPTIFKTQYLQSTDSDDNNLLPLSKLTLLPNDYEDAKMITRLCFVDPAEKNSDMMSVIFVDISLINDRFNAHIFDVIHNNAGYISVCKRIHERCLLYGIDKIFIEKNGVGLASVSELKNLNEGKDYKILSFHQRDNKLDKIMANYEFIQSNFSFNTNLNHTIEYQLFINHLTKFDIDDIEPHTLDAIDNCSNASEILKIRYKKLIYKKA